MLTEAVTQLLEQSVQTFRADSMQEALVRVRRELGPDALIVHTRQIEEPARFPWQKAKTITEILAANLPDAPEKITSRISDMPTSRRIASTLIPDNDDVSMEFSSQAKSVLQKQLPKSSTIKPNLPTTENTRLKSADLPVDAHKEIRGLVRSRDNSTLPENQSTLAAEARVDNKLEERLITLERMISHLTRQLQQQDWTELSPEWSPLYDQLTRVEVGSKLARELVHELKQSAQRLAIRSLEQKQLALKGLISAKLKCKPGLKLTPGKRTIAALIGPTGVGKTTTLAKLAASFTLRQNLKIGLITIDTYRIAAVDQLRTYAEIINIPMQVVSSQNELNEALKQFSQYDLVLIDTAGRSPQDELKVNELKAMFSNIQVTETFLVMSAVASLSNLEHTLNVFSPIGTTSLILTKLDEHSNKGQLLNLLHKTNLPLSYITTGQDVPHDISPAEASHITNLLFS